MKLRVLDISHNSISSFSGLPHLTELREFWANNNNMQCFRELEHLSSCEKLLSVYLECNPWCASLRYMAIVREYLPTLQQIDATILKWY